MISANQLYKESGSTLPFREWIEREKSKGVFIPNVSAMEEYKNADGGDDPMKPKTEENALGKNLVFVGFLIIGALLIYKISKKGAN